MLFVVVMRDWRNNSFPLHRTRVQTLGCMCMQVRTSVHTISALGNEHIASGVLQKRALDEF